MSDPQALPWRSTACVLCSINCGIEVRVADRGLVKIRGDRKHPASKGYTCEKALRLDHYQRGEHRLDAPLRRRADGAFERVEWRVAIDEIASRLGAIRDAHGGETIFYYGGGGQANHLGGGYGASLRAALGSVYTSNALAQEKTGEFWVDGKLFGRPRCHTSGDFEHAEVAVFVGKNPWHSHGFPRARVVLKEIAGDPSRSLVVIDPRRTETAAMADVHLQVIPGTDAWCLAAIVAVMVQESLVNGEWISLHARGFDDISSRFGAVDVAAYCAVAGVAEVQVRGVARRIARASSVSVFEDLGVQQAPNSTLCSYLEKLVYLLAGSFAKRGGMNIHTRLARLSGGAGGAGGGRERRSPVTQQRIITGLIPAAAIPDEVLSDHPKRFRAMIVESANPAHSLPDSPRMREALDALECLVVIDVALTETARHAHFVLPASSQYEKWEAAFFTLEFPRNTFQLRAPVIDPLPGTLAEPEIHRRLVRALGAYTDDDLAPLHAAAAMGRESYAMAFVGLLAERPELSPYAAPILYETLGPTLGEGREAAAAVWGLAQTCFMAYPESVQRAGFASGDALFEAIVARPEGVTFTVDPYEETWARVDHPDGRVNLADPELVELLDAMPTVAPQRDPSFPFVLSAGERRTSSANTIFRDPTWRTKDVHGALRINPDDARSLGVRDGDRVRVTTARGHAEAVVELTDTLRAGHITLPNGAGIGGAGVSPNELTSSARRDPIAGTPWHKHVPARLERVA